MQWETLNIQRIKNSVGYKLLCILSVPSSLEYKVIIGVSSQNLLMAIELIASK